MWCSPQETGLAESTGLSSATPPGAELCRHPECPSLQSSPIWKQGVRCWVGLLRCVCLHQPFPLQRAAQASWKLQGAGELLEEAEGSSKVDIALPSSPASPGRCHPEVLSTALCSGTAHAGALAELCPWVRSCSHSSPPSGTPGSHGPTPAWSSRTAGAAVSMGSRAPTFPLEACKRDGSKMLVMISRMRGVSAAEQSEECCRHSSSTKHPRWAAPCADSLSF